MADDPSYITEPEDIQLNEQDEVRQILGKPPGWILHFGITFIAIAMILLGIIAQIIKYPDTIPTRVEITTENPPIQVVSRVDGKLEELLVVDRQKVAKGDLIAVMESTANRQHVQQLLDFLDKQPADIIEWEEDDLPSGLQLDFMQEAYARFSKRFDAYHYERSTNTLSKQKRALKKQIKETKRLNGSLDNQIKTLQGVEDLKKSNWNRNKGLNGDGASSDLAVENAKAEYLDAKRQKESLESSKINNRVRITELEMRITEIRKELKDRLQNFLLELAEERDKLYSQLRSWQQNYLVKAPIDGEVSLTKVWSVQQHVKINEDILMIVPQQKAGKLLAKGRLPGIRAGKVGIGTRVNIRLDGYPYQEFGIVQSAIEDIAPVSEDGSYQIFLEMSDTLQTTYKKPIVFRQKMQGTGLVITENRSILERLLDRILSVFRN
ncbi:MAG: biotin/lipoyl-binding protein [Bacteroidota bacterium]